MTCGRKAWSCEDSITRFWSDLVQYHFMATWSLLSTCHNAGASVVTSPPDNHLSFPVPFNHVAYWVTETNGPRQKFLSPPCGRRNTKKGFWRCSITAGRAGGGRRPWGNSSGADLACRQPQVLLPLMTRFLDEAWNEMIICSVFSKYMATVHFNQQTGKWLHPGLVERILLCLVQRTKWEQFVFQQSGCVLAVSA